MSSIRRLSRFVILILTVLSHCAYALDYPKTNDGLKKSSKAPRRPPPVWASPKAVKPTAGGAHPSAGIIGRQPPYMSQMPMMGQMGQGPFPGQAPPFPNPWQQGPPAPFPSGGGGPQGPPPNFQMMSGGPGGWPQGPMPPPQGEWGQPFPPQGPQQAPQSGAFGPQPTGFFPPQPSQWPFVETAGFPMSPQGNSPALRWGQSGFQPQGPPPPPMMPPPGSNQQWQGPPAPAIYSQWLPSTLGNVALPPSPPWSAPGTIIGGPQLSPQGPWSAAQQPFVAYNPSTNGATPSRPSAAAGSMPQYIRSGYDATFAAASAQSTRTTANSLSRYGTATPPSVASPRFVNPSEPQSPVLEPAYVNSAEMGAWQQQQQPELGSSMSVQVPSANYNFSPGTVGGFVQANPYVQPTDDLDTAAYAGSTGMNGAEYGMFPYPQQPPPDSEYAAAAAAAANVPLIRGRDANPALPIPSVDGNEYEQEPRPIVDFIYPTTPIPTTAQTDDPYALNPNIIFGGPASITFPELTLANTQGGGASSSLTENGPTLSASSIRIGDILSFPHGTGFGAVPPPPPASPKKGINAFNVRTHQDDARLPHEQAPAVLIEKPSVSGPRIPGSSAVRIIPIQDAADDTPAVATASTAAPPITTDSPPASNQVDRNPVPRSYKGIKHSQNQAKATAGTLTDAILNQIQELKVVLYGRSNCTVCQETEALLKNYSIPVYFFELDNDSKGEQMLTIVQQMTHSLEMPLTFICGRFVGGHQRLHDLHVNQQITPMLRECLPSKRRASSIRVERK